MHRSSALLRLALGTLFSWTLTFSGLALAQNPPAATSSDLVTPATAEPPAEPGESTLKNPPSNEVEPVVADPMSLVPDLPPVRPTKATLIGGTIEKLDRVRDQMTVRVFGGGRVKILFDPRTRITRNGIDASMADLRQGERISIDTMLDGITVFARNIRLQSAESMGDSQGTVLKYRADRGELTIRDAISSLPVRVMINASTKLIQGDQTVSASVLAPGSLIAVRFAPDRGGHEVAHEISVLALPGSSFTFAGEVVNLDLHTGLLVLHSSTDRKVYEIFLDPSVTPDENLRPGANVTLITNFDGTRYVARQVTINAKEQ